jgi:2,3-bisphosphoglycerate-independent phosphoglycerate mutase
MAEYPNCLIHTSGEDVGLPDGTMGNREVGHQNLGAGRIVPQESVRISRTIRDGSFFENKEFQNLIKFIKDNSGKMHVMGQSLRHLQFRIAVVIREYAPVNC